MIIRFYKKADDNSAEFIKELKVKGKVEDKDLMTVVDLNICSVAKEILGSPVQRSGFKSIRSCGDYWSSFRVKDGAPKDIRTFGGFRETALFGKESVPGDEMIVWNADPVALTDYGVGGIDTDLVIGVDVFDAGYIISSTKKMRNLFGGETPGYFDKITSKNFKWTSRPYARIFKDEKALLKYLKDHIDVFKRISADTGCTFDWEKKSSKWEHEPKAQTTADIDAIFDEINGFEETLPEESKTYGETPDTEAVIRMHELDLHGPIIVDFIQSNKLYMSEFGGILYDLNDEAKEAVKRTLEYGKPYHVVRTHHRDLGDMYAVLYVSNWKDDWSSERPDKNGILYANVYTPSIGICEIGTIGIESANGGLVRVA